MTEEQRTFKTIGKYFRHHLRELSEQVKNAKENHGSDIDCTYRFDHKEHAAHIYWEEKTNDVDMYNWEQTVEKIGGRPNGQVGTFQITNQWETNDHYVTRIGLTEYARSVFHLMHELQALPPFSEETVQVQEPAENNYAPLSLLVTYDPHNDERTVEADRGELANSFWGLLTEHEIVHMESEGTRTTFEIIHSGNPSSEDG